MPDDTFEADTDTDGEDYEPENNEKIKETEDEPDIEVDDGYDEKDSDKTEAGDSEILKKRSARTKSRIQVGCRRK